MAMDGSRFLSRRDFLRLSAGALGTAGLVGPSLLSPPRVAAFPPDPLFRGIVRMVYHENPWGPHPAAVQAVREVMGRGLAFGGVNRYPDFPQDDLKQAVLRYNGLEGKLTSDNVILGLGSAELLFMATDAFSSPQVPFLTEWITYRIIIQRAEQNGAEIVTVPLRDNWEADLDRTYEAVKSAGDQGRPFGLVHFNVINNPAGTYLKQEAFSAFADRVYALGLDTVILCDDSDREYMDPALQPDLFRAAEDVVEGRNMLHVQTFSHIFGLTGMRVGYGFARREIVEKLEAHRIFSDINVLGHAAALASVEHAGEQIRRCNAACMESREQLYGALDRMGLEFLPSQGHYNLINLQDMDGTLAVLLMYTVKKVFVRWGFEWDLDTWIRVNPSTEYENDRFLDALTWVLGQKDLRGIPAAEYLGSSEGRRLTETAARAGFPRQVIARAARPPGSGRAGRR
jgi:histidinol-phosphate aminotransferase